MMMMMMMMMMGDDVVGYREKSKLNGNSAF